jgi:RNA-directed DNA polymerase
MEPTEPHITTATKLERISWLSRQDQGRTFNCLMHHINLETLTAGYHELSGRKAVGPDKVTKDEYGAKLEDNLTDLIARLKGLAYKPGSTRRVLIPKEGQPGATRPLDIANFEDKLLQRTMARVLGAVYEPVFLDCSYGFRPGLGCHDAIRALSDHLFTTPTSVVIDVDLANYFGSIRQDILLDLMRHKIGDKTLLRYVARILKAGVLADGALTVSDDGVPQGSPISPILANIFAHYVIDEWFEKTVKTRCTRPVALFRYADDAVICCATPMDAEWIRTELALRLAQFGLKLNEDKTHSVSFSRRGASFGYEQGTFDFLGLTFYLGKSANGHFIAKPKTSKKRRKSKLKKVKEWMKTNRSRMPLEDLWRTFRRKMAGHIEYYAVSHNLPNVESFLRAAVRIVWRWLNRRGGKRRLTWDKMVLVMERFPLPTVKLRHPLFTWSPPAQ